MRIVIHIALYIHFFFLLTLTKPFLHFFLFSVEVSCIGLHVLQREMEGFGGPLCVTMSSVLKTHKENGGGVENMNKYCI